jgi:hypothetical protein
MKLTSQAIGLLLDALDPMEEELRRNTGRGSREVRADAFGDLELLLTTAVALRRERDRPVQAPIPMIIHCPDCSHRHVDKGEFATKPHHTHACQACGMVWRPSVVPTVGVRFLPGFKDEETVDG